MEKIAIQYTKIQLHCEDAIFQAVGIIHGEEITNNGATYFIDECGVEYEPIDDIALDIGHYYMFPTSLQELRKVSQNFEDCTDEELLNEFYTMFYDTYFAVTFDFETGEPIVTQFNIDNIQCGDSTSYDINEDGGLDIVMPLEQFKGLKEMKTKEEVDTYVDDITSGLEYALKYLEDNNLDPNEAEYDMDKKTIKTKAGKVENINLKKLRKYVLQNVIDQEKAVNDITRTIVINSTSKNPRNKSHILIAGPTGTGKTEIVNLISEKIGVPVFKADATAYTKEGYVGKSVYSMLEGLINAANGDVDKAKKGILIIDEIDKKATPDKGDVSGQDVLFSLLKILDRGEVEVNTGGIYGSTVLFDTSDLTIICMGAFSDLYDKKKKEARKTLGFGGETKEEVKDEDIVLTEQDFVKYGMPPEFMGRVCITYTKPLNEESLLKILNKSKISPLNIEKEYFEDLGVKVIFTKDYKKEIVNEALKAGTGARKLKGSVKRTLENVYDDALMGKKNKTYTLTKATVKDSKKYYVK